jgi:hypothetical protein
VIQESVLEAALEKQGSEGGRLGRILIAMGALDEEMLVRTVARQLDMPVAWLRGKQVKAEVLAMLPAHIARRHRCLPVMVDRKGPETLLVAMEDPSDAAALDDIASAAGRPVRVVLASPSELEDALARHYPGPADDDEPEPEPEPEPAADPDPASTDSSDLDAPDDDDEPELLLTDPLGQTSGGDPDLRRLSRDDDAFAAPQQAAPQEGVDPLDLGGDYDPLARPDIDADLGEASDLEEHPRPEPANLEPGPELGLSHELAPGEDLGLDIGPEPAPHERGDGVRREREFVQRQGDSLDDAIGEVRGAYGDLGDDSDPAADAQDEEGPSLFGDDPLEVTLPPSGPRPQADGLPRDPELRAVVLLLIERGLLTREEVSERLLSLGRDTGRDG